MLSMAPTAVHLLGRILPRWKDICFPQGQMKQNTLPFVAFPFGEKKNRQICCWVVVQWAHKYHIKIHRPIPLEAFVPVPRLRVWMLFGLMAKPHSSWSEWALQQAPIIRTFTHTHTRKILHWRAEMHHPSITTKLWEALLLISDNEDGAGQRRLRRAWHLLTSTFCSVKAPVSPFRCTKVEARFKLDNRLWSAHRSPASKKLFADWGQSQPFGAPVTVLHTLHHTSRLRIC